MAQQFHPRQLKTPVHKNLNLNDHSSIIHNSTKGEQPKCLSGDEQLNKMRLLDKMGYSLSMKTNDSYYNMDKPWKHYAR